MTKPIIIEIVEPKKGDPHIRIKSRNGRIMLSSETYQGGTDKAWDTVAVIIGAIQAQNFKLKNVKS